VDEDNVFFSLGERLAAAVLFLEEVNTTFLAANLLKLTCNVCVYATLKVVPKSIGAGAES
jgi:hypothetical protein